MRAGYLSGLSVAALLIASGLSAATPDTHLVEAAKNQDWKTAHALIDHHAHVDVNVPDAEGMTPLLWAAHWDDAEMVTCLIEAGANVKATNRYGSTALHEAATFGDAQVITALLKAGADPNAVRGEGDTPLLVATRAGLPDAVRLLLDAGASVDARETWYGETPLMVAVAEDYTEVTKLLIDHHADVNAVSTTFPYRHRPQVDATYTIDPSLGGLTPLHFAARKNAIESAKLLIAAGADLNRQDPDFHFTPLLVSIVNDNVALATLLVEKGAQVNDGSLAALAQMRNRPGVVDKNDGHFAVKPPEGSLELMKLMLAHGADPNLPFTKTLPFNRVKAQHDATPFYVAAKYVDLPAMKLLLASGAKTTPLKDGTTPLMAVMSFDNNDRPTADPNYDEALQLCLDAGIDVNAANNAGNTALHYAAGYEHDASVQYLVDRGANLNAKTKMNRTPLDWAEGKRPSGLYGAIGDGGEQEGLPHYPSTIALLQKLMNKTTAQVQ